MYKIIIISLIILFLTGCFSIKQKKGSLEIYTDGSITAVYENVQVKYDSELEKFIVVICEDPNCIIVK